MSGSSTAGRCGMTTVQVDPLDYYARHSCALFPIPAGQKIPGPKEFWPVTDANGNVNAGSFKHDNSTDPEQWKAWRTEHPGCNFGIVAFASRLIIVDIDTTGDRDEAWTLWCELCASWGVPVLQPHTQSARGGWHVLCSLPTEVDAASLRQPDAIKKRINLRCVGYTVAAGSYYDGTAKGEASGPYTLISNEPPHPAPAALIEFCTRKTPVARTSTLPGARDKGDVAALLRWLNEHDAFADYESWFQIGMALKLEYGDDGFDLWALCHDETVTADAAASKWESFATDPDGQSVTLNTFLDRAHKLGWRGSVRKSTSAMFDSVAQLAAASGATLSSALPTPPGPSNTVPMMAGQEELSRVSAPILEEFLAATTDAPSRPFAADIPSLPPQMCDHGLYQLLNDTIVRVLALSEMPKFKASRCTSALAVLYVAHKDVFDSVKRRIETAGRTVADSKIKLAAKSLEDQVQRAFVKQDDWIYDQKGLPEPDNPDNVVAFLGIIGAEIRWNAWLNRAEIQGFEWPKWCAVDDVVVAKLKMRALRTGTRFRVGNDFLRETLLAISHANQFDPVIERINSLTWDGLPRLDVWLSATCGVPMDAYHAAVGKNVIGGMVKRARTPGAKHDEVMILIGKQGTAKSTLCRTLAMNDEWFTDSVAFDGSPQNIVPQLFGKLVVELAELDGMAKKEVQHIKAFITRQSDNVTLKYKAFAADFSRRCVFIGTSNEDSPLVDITGNRRFLPVRVGSDINIQWLRDNRDQLVAEAAHLAAAGHDFSIPREVWAIAGEHQELARSVTDIEARLCEWFAEAQHTSTAFVTTMDLAELSDITGWKNMHALRNSVMKRLGFREVRPYFGAVRIRAWLRGTAEMTKLDNVTRYMVGKDKDGRPIVTIRTHVANAVGLPMPPSPTR